MSGTALEPQLLDRTNGHDVLLTDVVDAATELAGEVATESLKRGVGEGVLAVRDGLGHDHVGVHDRSTENGDHKGFGEHREDERNFWWFDS